MHTHTAVLVIDMQNDFVEPQSPLCVAGAAATIPAIAELLAHARQMGWTVIYVNRDHDPCGADAEKFRQHLFANGGSGYTVGGSHGAEVVADIAPQPGDIIVHKVRFSGFFATKLDLVLRRLAVKRLILCGTQYPNCVRATAVDGISLDYEVLVCRDATSAATSEIAAANIRDLENMGIACPPIADIR